MPPSSCLDPPAGSTLSSARMCQNPPARRNATNSGVCREWSRLNRMSCDPMRHQDVVWAGRTHRSTHNLRQLLLRRCLCILHCLHPGSALSVRRPAEPLRRRRTRKRHPRQQRDTVVQQRSVPKTGSDDEQEPKAEESRHVNIAQHSVKSSARMVVAVQVPACWRAEMDPPAPQALSWRFSVTFLICCCSIALSAFPPRPLGR
jgi:hypothetical protein